MYKIIVDWRFSGGTGNTNPANSLGGAISDTDIVNNTDNNLFNDIDLTDASTGKTYYRCIYIINRDVTYAQNLRAWISSQTPHIGTKIYIGLGSSGLGGVEPSVGDEFTEPSGVVFSDPQTDKSGLYLGGIPVGVHKAIWIKLVISPDSSGIVADYGRISISGEEVAIGDGTMAAFVATASTPSPLNNLRYILTGEYAGWFLNEVAYYPYYSGEDFDEPISNGDSISGGAGIIPGLATHFYANNNALSGGILALTAYTNLRVIDVSDNVLTSYEQGIFPAAMTIADFSNNALNETSVNNLLVDCDAIGLGTGFTLSIDGGTNAAPTGVGITAKANLIARGAAVTTN